MQTRPRPSLDALSKGRPASVFFPGAIYSQKISIHCSKTPRARISRSALQQQQQVVRSASSDNVGSRGERHQPLRILFCGSDNFSIASLKALDAERNSGAGQSSGGGLIESIDVVCRPGKRVGRGLKEIREVPIKAAALRLGLNIHEIDTFTGWTPPKAKGGPFNLIIAVSFGLFIPPRILGASRYGGLNVHPSLLPDLHGPAPIQWSIIHARPRVGVTIQTLSEHSFDSGIIVSQTYVHPSKTPTLDQESYEPRLAGGLYREHERVLAQMGASALVRDLKSSSFLEPQGYGCKLYQDRAGHEREVEGMEDWRRDSHLTRAHARKVTKNDRRVDWSSWTWSDIKLRFGALGDLWDDSTHAQCSKDNTVKRIRFHHLEANGDGGLSKSYPPGTPFLVETRADGKSEECLCITTADGVCLEIKSCTVESDKRGEGQRKLLRMVKEKHHYNRQ